MSSKDNQHPRNSYTIRTQSDLNLSRLPNSRDLAAYLVSNRRSAKSKSTLQNDIPIPNHHFASFTARLCLDISIRQLLSIFQQQSRYRSCLPKCRRVLLQLQARDRPATLEVEGEMDEETNLGMLPPSIVRIRRYLHQPLQPSYCFQSWSLDCSYHFVKET